MGGIVGSGTRADQSIMAEVQAALAAMPLDLLGLEDRCREILARVPRSPNEETMFIGEIAWDLPTELLTTTIESVK